MLPLRPVASWLLPSLILTPTAWTEGCERQERKGQTRMDFLQDQFSNFSAGGVAYAKSTDAALLREEAVLAPAAEIRQS